MFFSWLLNHGRLNTRAYLHHRNIKALDESWCVPRPGVLETDTHIFSSCNKAQDIWGHQAPPHPHPRWCFQKTMGNRAGDLAPWNNPSWRVPPHPLAHSESVECYDFWSTRLFSGRWMSYTGRLRTSMHGAATRRSCTPTYKPCERGWEIVFHRILLSLLSLCISHVTPSPRNAEVMLVLKPTSFNEFRFNQKIASSLNPKTF